MSEGADEVHGEPKESGGRRRRERVSRRRRQVKRGKRFVLSVLAASVLYYIANFIVVVADLRFGYSDDLVRLISTAILVGVLATLGTLFAVSIYRGNEVIRQLFLILNLIGGISGTIMLVIKYGQELTNAWMLMDLVGVVIAFAVCGALFLSRGGVMFLDEQNLRRR